MQRNDRFKLIQNSIVIYGSDIAITIFLIETEERIANLHSMQDTVTINSRKNCI